MLVFSLFVMPNATMKSLRNMKSISPAPEKFVLGASGGLNLSSSSSQSIVTESQLEKIDEEGDSAFPMQSELFCYDPLCFPASVKKSILLGDIHKSIYFLSWKENGPQLTLLAKDFGCLDCLAIEFFIDGSTLSLTVSDDQKNVQVFYYAPKLSESWKGQKLLLRAEFHVGAHVTMLLRLQLLPTSLDRTAAGAGSGSNKTNRFGLLFGTMDGSIGFLAPLDELTFRRLKSLHKKLVDAVPHATGLNPKSYRQFCLNLGLIGQVPTA